ncbi:hypothetical protein BDN67DRAFT_962548 [Paxillus ammoniavirescens]|nr:hypothetical protein BDN67DRAFT_962548 [Paxillus ammoniavirescens]
MGGWGAENREIETRMGLWQDLEIGEATGSVWSIASVVWTAKIWRRWDSTWPSLRCTPVCPVRLDRALWLRVSNPVRDVSL